MTRRERPRGRTGGNAPLPAGLAVVALWIVMTAVGEAAPRVLGSDDRPVDRAAVLADAGAYWVSDGASLPVLLRPDADNDLRLPDLPVARLLVLDATSGTPVAAGSLRWADPRIPEAMSTLPWSTRGGRLDIGCRGGESVTLSAGGYRAAVVRLEPDQRRRTVLLEPNGDLEIVVRPAAEGTLRLAAESEISVISPFFAAASEHAIGPDGTLVVRDLDAGAVYRGVVIVPGRAPVVGEIRDLPRRLELPLGDGLAVAGRVVDRDGVALARARITATGRIEDLGGFRYDQQARTGQEGRFSIPGLLAGEVEVRACAPLHACATEIVTIDPDTAAEPVTFHLDPGHDLRLVVQDEYGRPAAGATVIDTEKFRRHRTDDSGVLVFDGVRHDTELSLKILGAGLRPWQGRIRAREAEVVLRLPAGGVIEWPILVDREFAPDEVVATWSRLNHQGREIADGNAIWDRELRLVRAEGLEAGAHRLSVRMPGAATLVSESITIAPGEEASLPAAVPERGLAISGRVLSGATFQPLAGARVTCEPGSPHQFRKPQRLARLQTAVSDADGVFLLEGLDPGRCRAVVDAPGFAAWRSDDVQPDEAGADLGDIELDHGMTVVGRVIDRGNRPQAGVAVEITEEAVYAYFPETTTRTDHDGWFRADSLPVGRWVVEVSRGEQTARATVEGRSGETVETELRLGGMRLEGEIWIGDRPASGGHLVLATDGARGDGIVVMVQSDADQRRFFGVDRPPVTMAVSSDGRFAADGVSAGVYTASYTALGAGGSPVSRELVVPDTELHRCLIRFSDAGLDGRVIDPDGLPVAGAAVIVTTRDGRGMADGFSDGDGGFAFTGLDPAAARVTAIHSEFGDAEPVEVELRSGDRAGPVTIELQPPDGAELSLRVTSSSGSLSGAPVYLVGLDTLTGFTDDAGVAAFTGIEAGRHRPCAAAYGGAAGCGPEVDLADGDRRQASLELGRGGF
ncbi:MAG: carboxypeptidase-like regulatory domain-containing protein, partial [Candidatus Sulfomarinibacteraceae bacterium]